MTSPSISVVICTWNAVQYLQECLDSLFAQRDPAEEIIVVDGGSSDGTLELLEAQQLRFAGRLRWMHQGSTPGLGAARNAGVLAASGEIISFLDVDARAEAHWVQRVRQFFRQHPNRVALGGQGIEVGDSPADRFRARFYQQSWGSEARDDVVFLFGLCSHYRRDTLINEGLFHSRFLSSGEDVELGLRLRKRGYKLHYDPDVQVFHARRDDWPSLYKMVNRWAYFGKQAGLVHGHALRPALFWVVWWAYATARSLLRQVRRPEGISRYWWRHPICILQEVRGSWQAQQEWKQERRSQRAAERV